MESICWRHRWLYAEPYSWCRQVRRRRRPARASPLAALVALTLLCDVFSVAGVAGVAGIVLEGSATSYAQFHQWHGGPNTTLELEFRTDQANGLLLYTDSGPKEGLEKDASPASASGAGSGEYLQLSLVGGSVHLRCNWGTGARLLTAGSSLHEREGANGWHHVAVVKSEVETRLVVDRAIVASISAMKSLKRKLSASKSPSSSSSSSDASASPESSQNKKRRRRKKNQLARETDALFADESLFGNASAGLNSYVFVGGLPSWYGEKTEALALPTVLLEPRFRGDVRHVKYRDVARRNIVVQEMMAYKGVRASTVDACEHRNPCQNGGRCLPTDTGPACDCTDVEFKGKYCEKEHPAAEVTLRGGAYLTYDLVQRGIDPILSANDDISLYFKTRKSSGLLFYTGNEHDFMNLGLKDGRVALTVQLGSGKLDTDIGPEDVRFDDNAWHHVRVERRSSEVTLTVDGVYSERWITSGSFSILASSTVFVGGSEATYTLPGTKNNNNWVGCLKKVVFTADSLVLDLLKLTSTGNPLISVIGDIEWTCRDIEPGSPLAFQAPAAEDSHAQTSQYEPRRQKGIISFTREEAYLVLPYWKVTMSASISLQFRTEEGNGLLLFNSGPENDYFAMELMDGHLYIHLDLGSGVVKIRASRSRLNDGVWHYVDLTLRERTGRISIDGDTEAFEVRGEASQLRLQGKLYVGSVDYMDPYIRLPPTLWSATLRYGFVGCLQDLQINGASHDLVMYAHQQDVGSIRSSCHDVTGDCHHQPCMHGGKCTDGWNRYICDCSQTSFTGATCGNPAATLKFEGTHSMTLLFNEKVTTEADDILIRFRTREQNGMLLTTKHDRSRDSLSLAMDAGRIRVSVQLSSSSSEKTIFVGRSLNDDIYHSVVIKRRAKMITVIVDDDEPYIAELHGEDTLLNYSKMYIGGLDPGDLVLLPDTPGFSGSMQQLVINGRAFFELAAAGQLATNEIRMDTTFVKGNNEAGVHSAVSFASQNTFIGLPQMKAYNSINLRFMFRTFEQNGLLLYNAGKASDFIAIELISGRLHYTLNLGYGPITIKDDAPVTSLSDNKWHRVVIGRPSRFRHTLMVDGHIAEASTRGDNYNLDLDGILFLGGVRDIMYHALPRPLVSKTGFQGCFAAFETNGELLHPIQHALVPGAHVEEGCEESVAFEFGLNGGGIVEYEYPDGKQPDTNNDMLSLGFITPSLDAILLRVDGYSDKSLDFLQLEIVNGFVQLNYNLGSKDISLIDEDNKVNDGKYHVVRVTRNGVNSTLQVDDNKMKTKTPQGSKITSVFNDQALVQIGGRWDSSANRVIRHFVGVIAGAIYNGLRPLDLAAKDDPKARLESDVHRLADGVPFDYKDKNPDLFTADGRKRLLEESWRGSNGDQKKSQSGHDIYEINCDDEEDCVAGSGSGEGPGPGLLPGNLDEEDFYPRGTDSHYVPMSTARPEVPSYSLFGDYDDDDDSGSDSDDEFDIIFNNHLTTPANKFARPTLLPLPVPDDTIDLADLNKHDPIDDYGGGGGDNTIITNYEPELKPIDPTHAGGNKNFEEAFDEKWNVDETPAPEEPDPPPVPTKTMPGTMVLVIGIILGAFVAMVLIVIIVLKMRTRVDGAIKCDGDAAASTSLPRYQFASPNDYGEVGNGGPVGPGGLIEPETATTSLMEGQSGPGPVPLQQPLLGGTSPSNGFGGGLPPMNGDRSRLFRKPNGGHGGSKPVREWYV